MLHKATIFTLFIFLSITLSAQTGYYTARTRKIGTISKANQRYRVEFFAGKKSLKGKQIAFTRIIITNQKQVYTITHDQYVFCVPQFYEFTINQQDYALARSLVKKIINTSSAKGSGTNQEYTIVLSDRTKIRYTYPQDKKVTILKNNIAIPIKDVQNFARYLTQAINQSYKL
jgi:hypothetical protein